MNVESYENSSTKVFARGTKILTKLGVKNVESLVKDDSVFVYSRAFNDFVFVPVVTCNRCEPKHVKRLVHSEGYLNCSPTAKFGSISNKNIGWIDVDNLIFDAELFSYKRIDSQMTLNKSWFILGALSRDMDIKYLKDIFECTVKLSNANMAKTFVDYCHASVTTSVPILR